MSRAISLALIQLALLASCSDGGLSSSADAGPIPSDGAMDVSVPPPDATDGNPSSVDNVKIIVGAMAFNEPMNDGYMKDIIPSWNTNDLTISSSGSIKVSLVVIFAGSAPTADEYKDVLFWNVVGYYPSTLDTQLVPLSDTLGVLASAPSDRSSSVFSLDGSFSLQTQGPADTGQLAAVAVGFTWVRVYRDTGGIMRYQVFPGTQAAPDPSQEVRWDGGAASGSGSFSYYGPLEDGPSLGRSFDYPSWIRQHITW